MKANINVRKDKFLRILSYAMIAMILAFMAGCIWINLHSYRWYDYDMYPDSLVARMMWEQKSLFPEGWTFGNQYYVFATPTLAALLYGLVRDSVLAMSLASCINVFFVLLACYWCFKPFCKRPSLIIALLCMSGGIIIGTKASTYLALKYIYTQCSFYAAYWLVLFLSLGMWLRIRTAQKVSRVWMAVICILNICIGMNSLREMGVLILPLLATEVLLIGVESIKNKKIKETIRLRSASLGYVLILFVCSITGHLIIRLIAPNAFEIHMPVDTSIHSNLINVYNCLKHISGLDLMYEGAATFLLFLFAAFSSVVIILSFLLEVIRRPINALSSLFIFSVISLSAVIVCGCFFLRANSPYFFVYYLLVSVSYVIIFEQASKFFIKMLIPCCLLIFSGINWFMQFNEDIVEYKEDNIYYKELCNRLIAEGVSVVYQLNANPYLASYSHDQMISKQIVYYEHWGESDDPFFFRFLPCFLGTMGQEDLDRSVICISERGLMKLRNLVGEYSFHSLLNSWILIEKIENRVSMNNLYFYKQTKHTIDPTTPFMYDRHPITLF